MSKPQNVIQVAHMQPIVFLDSHQIADLCDLAKKPNVEILVHMGNHCLSHFLVFNEFETHARNWNLQNPLNFNSIHLTHVQVSSKIDINRKRKKYGFSYLNDSFDFLCESTI